MQLVIDHAELNPLIELDRHMSETLLTSQDVAALADAVADRISGQPSQRFLGVNQAANYAGVSPESIRRLLSSGKLSALRPVRGRVVIDRAELDAFVLGSNSQPRKRRGIRKGKK